MATGKFLKIRLGGDADVVRLREERKDRAGQEAKAVALEAKLSAMEAALYATVNALGTMYRVAKAYAQPTGTSIDGESQTRYPMAVREEAKARELFEPILRALYEERERKP